MATTRGIELFASLLLLPALSLTAHSSTCDKSQYRIVIDAGHSAAAPGAISARGYTEYEYNVRLTSLLEDRLRAAGYHKTYRYVAPARGDTLAERVGWANSIGPALFISVHHDSVQRSYLENWIVDGRQQLFSDRFRGWSLFVSTVNEQPQESLRFATLMADQLLSRGLPFSTHHAEKVEGEGRLFLDAARGIYRHDRLAVLRSARAPAVLFEAGVIVNRDEEAALASSSRQKLMADAFISAVNAFCSTE